LLLRNLTVTAALSVVLLACQDGDSRGRGPLVDDAGRTVSLEVTPSRIVSLAPGMTELLFAVGAGERVVGRTRWCDYPPAVADIPSVGDGLSPNVESILPTKLRSHSWNNWELRRSASSRTTSKISCGQRDCWDV
jgi:ABC-type Fe3+-hydroxamate transport system substrate-binding protein